MLKRYLPVTLAFMTLALALAGCPKGPKEAALPTTPTPKAGAELAGTLRIFVPCGVAGPYGEIKALFEQRYPGIKVTQDVANIDVQTKMIADGKDAPDVWISLGDIEVKRVAALGLIDGEPTTYGYNSVAMMVAKNNPCDIEDIKDLTKPAIKTIALPSEENSSGHYMKQGLIKAGVWDSIQDKLLLLDQPSQVKEQLASGKAEVGVVYYPCTRETRVVGGQQEHIPGKVQLLGKIPSDLTGPIPAQAAVIKGCQNPAAGHAYLQFLMEDAVQDIWENWAFDRAKQPAGGKRITLYLYCGAGIQPFMDKAIAEYKKVKPGVRIDVGYAGSGCLLSQLSFARRGDLYMPGEQYYLDQAKKREYITSEQLVGYFDPVLLVQKGNPKGIKGLVDLARPGIRVGIGEPGAAAVGRAAEAMLKKAGLTDKVEPNIRVRAGNVPELGNFVQVKSLDVAIVWNVTAMLVTEKCDAVKVAAGQYDPSPVPMGLLKFTENKAEAEDFIKFCTGAKGQELVAQSGMSPLQKGGTGPQ